MKNNRQKADTMRTRVPQIGRRTLLAAALVTAGMLSPLLVPNAAAASLPLPMGLPCGGCANLTLAPNAPANTSSNFVQYGNVTTSAYGYNSAGQPIDPITNLPINTLTITQKSQTAILNWQQFNIDPGYHVVFNQPSTTSSTLNRIWDANPTTIAGSLTANGQLYLINQNGILFANGAQVNTGALIASSLDISDALYQAGYLTNVTNGVTPAFGDGINGLQGFVKVDTGATLNGSRIMLFAPVVENNGTIKTPDGQTVLAAGTKVYLEASSDPNLVGVLVEVDVTKKDANGNDISVAGVTDPQLAANIIRDGLTLQHTEAGTVTNGNANNKGDISAERGNITLVGYAVNQQGMVSATTSVTENGSIKLLARYSVDTTVGDVKNAATATTPVYYDIRATKTGTVTLAAGSVTQVTPDMKDTATTTDGQSFNPSIVEVMGNTINMQAGSNTQAGSRITANGGRVTLAAISSYDPILKTGLNPTSGLAYQLTSLGYANSSFLNPNYVPAPAAGDQARVFLDSGSLIDVSGVSTDVSVARNIITVQLRGSQLADAPVQRANPTLWGKDVQVDIRQGTTLANYAAEEAQIGRTVAERSTTGGTVKLVSTGDVVTKSGSKIDLSGGKINYTGAYVYTTSLISNGVAYDIATASPDIVYQGIAGSFTRTSNKWGVSETFNTMAGGDTRGRWDAGYVEGKSAGTLTVMAPHSVVDGAIAANTVAGFYQRQSYVASPAGTAYKDTWQMLPQGGMLVIGNSNPATDASGIVNYLNDSNVTIQTGAAQLPSDFALYDPLTGNVNALPADFQNDIVLDARIFGSSTGLNRLAVYTNKTASVTSGTNIKLAAGGAITLQGDTVNMKGAIDAPSGTVKLGTAVTTSSVALTAGALSVGADGGGSHISTSGQWVNDSTESGNPDLSKPEAINGGNITLSSGSDLLVARGTLLDASGGAWLDSKNKLHGGNGGAITLASGATTQAQPFKAQLDGVNLRSYGTAGGKGGSLSIAAGDIVLGGTGSSSSTTLALAPAFFQNGGFTSYNLNAQGYTGLTVTAGSVIEPKSKSLILDPTASKQASGTDVNTFATVGLLPDAMRAPTSITLSQTKLGGTLKVDTGAVIRVDPTANISLNATSQLTVLGTLDAAAGSINLSLKKLDGYSATQSIWLGSQSKLLSQGYFRQAQQNAQNLIQGQVLAGGNINITANTGYVVAQQGSLMDVSGTSANLDLPRLASGNLVYGRSHVAGDAGSISVQTSEGAFFDGSMNAGVEAGSQAAAGKFSLTLNNSEGINNITNNIGQFPLNPAQIQVMASGNGGFATQAGLTPGDDTNAGRVSLTAIAGKALLDASALQKSGFDQVSLKSDNSIVLADQVTLQTRRSITLDAPQLVVNGNSRVSSAQVTIGNLNSSLQELLNPLDSSGITYLNPAAGSGTLEVDGQMVDLTGNFLVSGVKALNINSSGDIRANGVIDATNTKLTGSLSTQGDITLTAKQVYPSTLAQFTMSVKNDSGTPTGTITVQKPAGVTTSPGPVLSAGGYLKLSAADIEQKGVLKAPLGTIELNGTTKVALWKDSLTSVTADGLIIPFGLIEGGNTWEYDLTGSGILTTIAAPPQKLVTLAGPDVEVNPDAKVNLSGGGDLYANEFFAGSGGTVNVLDPAKAPANTYAIIPGISGFAPYDPQAAGQYAQTTSKTTLQSGASVYLAGGNGLAAGYYTLLPASYALLPGAYKVTAVSGYTDIQPGLGAATLVGGSQIMAGKFAVAGTSIQDARYSGFLVTPGSVVRTQSEYHDSYANAFFAAQAATNGSIVPRPIDAGQLIVDATGTLLLAGTFNTTHSAGSNGALVDLNGPGFDIVNTAGSGTAGGVELTTSVLNALGADSLLIGGRRDQATNVTTVGAGTVTVENSGATLSGPEIILAANNAVTVKAGSSLQGSGTFSGNAQNISVNGDGALLRVSSGNQVTVTRTSYSGTQGTLTVENGATVSAQNSVLLDATHATNIGDGATLSGKAFSVAAHAIDVGTNPAPAATSLALTPALLAQMQNFQDITLHSYNDINFYGQATLGGQDAQNNHLISNLVLNAESLRGFGSAGSTASIDAGSVTLMNNNGTVSSDATSGSGALQINADNIVLADGAKTIRGFDNVSLDAAQRITGQGQGSLTLSASANSNAHHLVMQGTLTGTAKSNQTITAVDTIGATGIITSTGYDTTILAPTVASATNGDIGAKLAITANSILDAGNIDLAAGALTLHATGSDITLDSTSLTSAAGSAKNIAGQIAYAPAGSIALVSDNGNVEIKSGAVVDVSSDAAGGGDAGSLSITATNGTVSVAGTLKGKANANYAQGSFTLDANKLLGTTPTANALTELDDTLTRGGFTRLRDMRVRTGELTIDADAVGTAARATAQTFKLTADSGNINVYGTVDASGTSGGNILLAAQNNVTLESGALLDAHASGSGQSGGKVTLETTTGTIELNNQRIDVHGDGNTGGSVLLRAPRINSNSDVALNNTGGASLNVSAGADVTVEAFKTYVVPASLTAANADTTTTVYKNEATAFTGNATAIKTRLGMLGNSNLHLTPGVELDSSGDITLATNLDLSTWRFNDGNGGVTEPGILTFRAAGNLNFGTGTTQASLTDGFTTANDVITSSSGTFLTLTPTTTASWSYRLVAGADTSSANVMAVKSTVPADGTVPTTGNVVLVPGKETVTAGNNAYNGNNTFTMEQVRTGTGFIDIAAGGNLSLGNRESVIYTAGQSSTATGMPTGTNQYYGVNGGDITIGVKGNVIGAATDELITDWQWRQGALNNDGSIKIQPAWWINIGSFRQNIATLGGGDVSVSAGGNINNLSVSAATSGYLDTATKQTVVLGGGNVSVTAGGDINSGIFYVGNGLGTIRAGGALGASRTAGTGTGTKSLYTLLALGQGDFDVRTGGDLNLQAVLNPTVLPTSWSQNPTGIFNTTTKIKNYFFTYDDTSGVAVSSLSGNVTLGGTVALNNTKTATTGFFYLNTTDVQGISVYPGSLMATALNGNITSNGFSMFPSASGNLELVAANDINLAGTLTMSDVTPNTLQAAAVTNSSSALTQNLRLGHDSVHALNDVAVILSAGGNIGGVSAASVGGLVLPEFAQIEAGQNVQNLSITTQNMSNTDTTSVVAGNDISNFAATVYGPGQVFLQAGGNVDLGSGTGVVTKGNLSNSLLPDQGASVTVLAGVGQGADDTQAFIDKYIDPASAGSTHGTDLIAYVNKYENNPPENETVAQAFTYFASLSKPLQDAFVRQVFFGELRSSGRDAVSTKNYQAGFDAIATLFPSSTYKGDINLYYSQIKTMRGGDINLLAPGGNVNAGLANPTATGVQKAASDLGIVTVKGGDVNAMVNNDFTVNQSRVFTLQGGNILLWSSYGNIDAGKGSKSVSSTPPPLLVVDLATGSFNVDATRSVVGSGIAVLLANKDVVPGSIDLIAPNGTVNAGDAGIRSAGDIFIAATRVVGADNISFGGAGAGVPVAAPAPVSVGMGNLQDASKTADEATSSIANMNDMNANDFKPSFLSVEVIGLGDQDCGNDEQTPGCKKGRQSGDAEAE